MNFSDHKYSNILNALDNSYWYSTESQVGNIRGVIENITLDKVAEMRAKYEEEGGGENDAPLVQVNGKNAVVNIRGVIMKRMNIMMQISGGTSAEMLTGAFKALAQRDDIERVILRVDSNGGSVNGIDVAAEALRELRQSKQVIAVADDNMNSAAYYIASAAHKIFVNPSTSIGSIGVISRIENIRKALEDKGVEVYTFRAGKYKQVPNSVEEVTEEGKQIVQSTVDKYYNDFVQAIKLNRNISLDEAKEMADGKVHKGSDAVEAGLADEEGTFSDVLAMIEAEDAMEDRLSVALATIEAQSEEITRLESESEKSKLAIKQMTEKMAEIEAREIKAQAERVVDAAIDEGKIAPMKRDEFVTMALDKGVDTLEAVFAAIPVGANTPKDDINLSSDDNEHSDDPHAPKTDTERRIMAQFGPLRERYNL